MKTQPPTYVKLLLILGGILALAYLTIRYLMPRLVGWKDLASCPIRILARFPLEPRKALYVVRAGSGVFLIGASEGGLHYLTALDPHDFTAFGEGEEQSSPAVDFSRLIKNFRTRKEP